MIEEIEIEERRRYITNWEDKIHKIKKYKCSNGIVHEDKEQAEKMEKYLEKKSKIICYEFKDYLFAPEGGKFWYFKNFDDFDLITTHECHSIVNWNNKEYDLDLFKKELEKSFVSGWYYLQNNYAGDYPDWTLILNPEEIKNCMKQTLEGFAYMSVIEQ